MKTKDWFLAGTFFALALSLAFFKCERDKNSELRYENTKKQANIEALTDTVRTTRAKNNELEFNRKSFITDRISDLEALNSDLAHELSITKGKVIAISKAGIVTKTVYVPRTYIDTPQSNIDSCDFVVGLDLDTIYSPGNYKKVRGYVQVNKQTSKAVIEDSVGISLVTGLKENEKGDYEIFARSQYPGLVITDLKGAYIPKNQLVRPQKPQRISLGLQFGYSPMYYDLDYKKFGVANQLTLGLGLTYKFF